MRVDVATLFACLFYAVWVAVGLVWLVDRAG